MPVLDIDPGQSPEAPGTLYFFEQGRDPSTGARVMSDGRMLAPGNDSLVWPPAEFQPADVGYKGWTYDPALAAGGSAATNGTVYLSKVPVRADFRTVAVSWAITSAGATPTAGQNHVGIYDPDGDLLNSANVDADITSTGVKATTLAVDVLAGFVWVAFVFNAATPPTLARASTFASTPNAGLTAAGYRFCNNGTGRTTLAATITPGSNSLAAPLTYWAALS